MPDDIKATIARVAAHDTQVAQRIISATEFVVPDTWVDCKRSVDLCAEEYPDPEQFVRGFLTVGVTVLSATPKAGKTWLVHELALGVAVGKNALGALECEQADILCLFFEDSERRVITRERKLLGNSGGRSGIAYCFSGSIWTLSRIERWLDVHGTRRVVIIDTAERFKQMHDITASGRVYGDDYKFWGSLQEVAIQRNVAFILLHHDRKPTGSTGNALDSVSGTRAITGSADHVWLLDRNRETGVSTLSVIGRDLEEASVQFSRGSDGRLRAIEAPKSDFVRTLEQRAKAKEMCAAGKSLRDIAAALGVAKRPLAAGATMNSQVKHGCPICPVPLHTPTPWNTGGGWYMTARPTVWDKYGTRLHGRRHAATRKRFCPIGCPTVSHSCDYEFVVSKVGVPYCGTEMGQHAK